MLSVAMGEGTMGMGGVGRGTGTGGGGGSRGTGQGREGGALAHAGERHTCKVRNR